MGFCIIVIGYLIQNSLIQYYYYFLHFNEIKKWKIQPKLRSRNSFPTFFAPPLLSNKANQAPYHNLLGTINLLVAGCFAGYLSYISYSERCPFSFDVDINIYRIIRILSELFVAVLWESVIEYYWHRMMHLKWFYVRFHKFHHAYKAPEVWDDMYIHPLEAFGYYCILYAPPFLLQMQWGRMHIISFVLYMIIMGVCGVLDHSGVSFSFWLPFPAISSRSPKSRGNEKSSNNTNWLILTLYNTKDHDLHHQLYNVNYSFPFPFMDMLHGTYLRE